MVQYSQSAQDRAWRAWRCSPFQKLLVQDLMQRGVSLAQISGQRGYQTGYTLRPLSEDTADRELMWLIQVGLLRREVDGQGITDSYRLAPLGYQILSQMTEPETQLPPTLQERLLDGLTRWGA